MTEVIDLDMDARTHADSLESELQVLTAQFERDTVARPPSKESLSLWEVQSDLLLQRLQPLSVPGKSRLIRSVERFRARVAEMSITRERYIARRQPPRALSHDQGDWVDLPPARQQLSEAIHKQLEVARPLLLGAAPAPVGTAERSSSPANAESPAAAGTQSEIPLVAPPTTSPGSAAAASSEQLANRARNPDASRPRQARDPPAFLAPATLHHRRHSTRLDPIIAIEGRLARANSFFDARNIALDWLRKKGFKLPTESADNFEVRVANRGHVAIAVGSPGVWALQAETADSGVKGRRWRVEMVLVDAAPTPAVAVTLTAVSPADQPAPGPSIPGLVATLIAEIGLLDPEAGEVLNAGPTLIGNHAALHGLLATLQSPRRSRPVVVLSTYNKDAKPSTLLDPEGLANKLGGLAKVYVLTREMSWALTEALSRRFAVAGASVRLFRPGFTPDDEPGRHPAWDPTALTAQGLNLNGLSNRFLSESAYASLRALEREDAIPAFERVREQLLRKQIEEAKRKVLPASTQSTQPAEIGALKSALHDASELGELFASDNEQLRLDLQRVRDERDSLNARVYHLQSRVDDLHQKLRDEQGNSAPEFPDSWDALEEWCDQNLGERVVLTSKAIRAARDSDFLSIPFAYEVLWFLSEVYVPSKRGLLDGGNEYLEAEKARLGIDISPVGKASEERRSKESYSTNYKRERVILNMHVKGSSDREGRFAFRVYFHWHEGDQCVVVGSLPSHLDNGLT